tara:strand:- start:576 stop:683 length:108 start_codon:yes stop_codon:yes gene_type:complete
MEITEMKKPHWNDKLMEKTKETLMSEQDYNKWVEA